MKDQLKMQKMKPSGISGQLVGLEYRFEQEIACHFICSPLRLLLKLRLSGFLSSKELKKLLHRNYYSSLLLNFNSSWICAVSWACTVKIAKVIICCIFNLTGTYCNSIQQFLGTENRGSLLVWLADEEIEAEIIQCWNSSKQSQNLNFQTGHFRIKLSHLWEGVGEFQTGKNMSP